MPHISRPSLIALILYLLNFHVVSPARPRNLISFLDLENNTTAVKILNSDLCLSGKTKKDTIKTISLQLQRKEILITFDLFEFFPIVDSVINWNTNEINLIQFLSQEIFHITVGATFHFPTLKSFLILQFRYN